MKKRRRSVHRKLTKRRKSVANSVLVEAPIVPVSAPRFSFSGHQTFPFRYAWLPKGIRGLEHDPKLFSKPDAMVTLGVGKNMVDSIRFWCGALKLAVIDGRSGTGRPTELGSQLLGSRGWTHISKTPRRCGSSIGSSLSPPRLRPHGFSRSQGGTGMFVRAMS